MKLFLRSCLLLTGLALTLAGRMQMHAQSTLAAGDLLFTSFSTNPPGGTPDTFSFVLLVPISSNTTIYFTDRGWNGSAFQGTGGTEGTIGWTSGGALPIGTEVQIAGLGGTAATVNGVPNGSVVQILGGNAVSGLSIGNGGDQLMAFQNGAGDPTAGGVTKIAGIHFSNCTGTSDASWDPVACASGPSASAMYVGLVGGTSAFWAGAFQTQGRFVCNGAPFSSTSAMRTAIMDRSNWVFNNNQFTTFINVPPGCFYYSTCPVVSSAIITPTNITCNGGTNGAAVVSASGGSGFTYDWTPGTPIGDGTSTISNLAAGTYTVLVTNSCGQTRSSSVTLTQPSVIATGPSQSNVSCFGGNNGIAVVNASGGSGSGYTYSWTPSGGSGSIASGLTANTYTVTVTDGAGCTRTQTYNITQPPAITTSTGTVTNVSCNGGNNGSAQVIAGGGAGGFTYSWAPSGGTSATGTGLAQGTYTVTVTDANSCTKTHTFSITQPGAITTSTGTVTNVSCNGGNNGSAQVIASGGTGSLTYSWAPSGGTSATATGLVQGTYTVTVTDANSCTKTHTFSITQPPAITTSSGTVNNVSCNGGSNGTATVIAGGGTGSLTYSWAPSGGTGATATGLAQGTYTVTVTDANSCTKTHTFNITQPSAITTTSGTVNNVSCNGGSNGSAQVIAGGGTGTLTYSWSPSGGTGTTASGLAQGTYTVTVTDANSCTKSHTFSITQPTVINLVSGGQTNPTCGSSNGSVTVNASGGAGSFTYSWAPSGGTGPTASGLAAGNYTVTVTDANSCTQTLTYTLSGTSTINTSSGTVNNVSCNGGNNGSATVIATGGTGTLTYSWSPSGGTGTTASGLAAGNYTVTVTDGGGCTKTHTFNITQPPAITTTPSQSNVLCFGGTTGSATVTAGGGVGGYTYSWSPSGGTGSTANGLAQGNYTVTVTDANSCTRTQTYTITQPTVISTTPSQTNVSCFGGANGSATVVAGGGAGSYTYSWSPSGGTGSTANGLAQGNYTVTVTDANSCTRTQTYTITQPAASVSGTTVVTNVSCFGGTNGAINLTPTGGTGSYTFNWGGGITIEDRTGLAAGSYTVTITDANSCTGSVSATVTQPTNPISGTTIVTNIACFGNTTGAINLTPTGGIGGYTFNWGGGITSEDRTGLAAGSYTVTITDANSCTGSVSATVTQPGSVVSGTTVVTNVSCFGGNNGAINLTPAGGAGGYTFNWGGGITSEDRTGLAAGSYTVTITDQNGCTTSVSATVTQSANAVSGTTVVTNVSCFGGNNGAINLTPTGGTGSYTFNWGGGVTTEDRVNLAAGSYTVTITDANSCTGSVTATVTQPAASISGTTVVTNVACFGGTTGAINLTPTGGVGTYTFNWGGGITTEDRTGLAAGSYTVTITDANGCTGSVSATLTQPGSAISGTTSVTNTSCFGGNNGAINLTPAGGVGTYTFNWGGGITTEDRTGLAAGSYTVTITDANGCTGTVSATVTQPSAITGTTVLTGVSCFGGSNGAINLTPAGGAGGYTFNWGGGITTEDRTGLAAGSYTVTITDASGCTGTVSATVTEPAALSLSSTVTGITCSGGSNGNIDLTVSGGTSGYSYSWSNSATTQDLTGVAAGTYTVTVTDANSCSATLVATISSITPMTGTTSTTNVSCFGGNNGSASLSITGGTAPLTFSWSSGGSSATENNLGAGSYSVLVTDSNGCTFSSSVTITQPLMLIASIISSADVVCNGDNNGAATVQAGYGTPGYSYLWSPSGGTNTTASNLAPGSYTVSVTDQNGCTATSSVAISEPTVLAVSGTVQDALFNNGGAVDIQPSGGVAPYTFNWSTGASTEDISGINPGTYTVTVTDDNGCTQSATFTVHGTSGVDEVDGVTTSIYPNPTNGIFTVAISSVVNDLRISITDLSGKELMIKNADGSGSELNVQVDASALPSGTYLVRIAAKGTMCVHPLIIVK